MDNLAMTPPDTPERELIQRALDQLREQHELNIIIKDEARYTGEAERTHIPDTRVTIDIQGQLYLYAVEAKRIFTKATIFLALQHPIPVGEKPLLIAEYINPEQAAELQRQDIAFADTVGNAYLKAGPVYIYVRGNRPEKMPRRAPGQATRAFQATGLRVIFGLLHRPELVKATYRDIAKATGVARGTVGEVLNGLREAGYVLETRKGRQVIRKRQLFDRWIAGYHERLKPKLWLGRFEAPTRDWWQTVNLQPWAAVWGGEVAAAKLTDGFLRPGIVTIYVHQLRAAELIVGQRLRKNPNGGIHIFQTFWLDEADPTNQHATAEIADPLLVYADLVGTGDDRNRETAQLIFDGQLRERFPNE